MIFPIYSGTHRIRCHLYKIQKTYLLGSHIQKKTTKQILMLYIICVWPIVVHLFHKNASIYDIRIKYVRQSAVRVYCTTLVFVLSFHCLCVRLIKWKLILFRANMLQYFLTLFDYIRRIFSAIPSIFPS